MKYKLLVLDVDGTLIPKFGEPVSKVVEEAVFQAKNAGVKISLCTGKSMVNAMPYIKQLQIEDGYSIVEGGAKILGPQYNIVKKVLLNVEDVRQLFQEVTPFGDSSMACTNGQWLDIPKIKNSDEVSSMSFVYQELTQEENILKKLKQIDVASNYHYNIASHLHSLHGGVVILTHRDANKYNAIEYIKNILKLPTEETIAIGDMSNDVPMFKAVGFKAAMGNGNDEIKQLADYIAPSIHEDGVADVINKFILN